MSGALRVAIYARVSSDRQAQEGTIGSQVEELTARVTDDGFVLSEELRFVDDGFSGATLVRPALEKVRDISAFGGIDRLYVHSPDRLARKYAYQVLLLDELSRAGVEVVFLNHQAADTPEENLLLQVQGMVAEYERAKIMERSRRGNLHAARAGRVSVLGAAPYGYRYVTRAEGGGEARYDVVPEQAQVVRRIFDWIARSRISIAQVVRRLDAEKIPTPRGKRYWHRGTLAGMLRNPAYKGEAAYRKTKLGERRPRLRPPKGCPEIPRTPYSRYRIPREEWISVPVPAIVSKDVFDAVREQLAENRKRFRSKKVGNRYLLQGLTVCARCARAYVGITNRQRPQSYSYYRCQGKGNSGWAGLQLCDNGQLKVEALDAAVWSDVSGLLSEPERIEKEFRRRLEGNTKERRIDESEDLRRVIQTRKTRIARLIDAYADGLLDKSEFESRIRGMKEGVRKLEDELRVAADAQDEEARLRFVITRLEEFAERVGGALDDADWSTRREIIRSLVKQIEIDHDAVRIVYRLSSVAMTAGKSCHDCRGRVQKEPVTERRKYTARIGDDDVQMVAQKYVRMDSDAETLGGDGQTEEEELVHLLGREHQELALGTTAGHEVRPARDDASGFHDGVGISPRFRDTGCVRRRTGERPPLREPNPRSRDIRTADDRGERSVAAASPDRGPGAGPREVWGRQKPAQDAIDSEGRPTVPTGSERVEVTSGKCQ